MTRNNPDMRSPAFPDVTLIVLAGGGSRRMGTDKTRLSLAGRTFLDHVLNQIQNRFGETFVSVPSGGPSEVLGFPSVRDERNGFGPMEGIRRGLEIASHTTCFILACDIPEIDFGLVERLLRKIDSFDIAVPINPDGTVEPLYGAYRNSVKTDAERLLAENRRSVLELFDICRTAYVPLEAGEKLINLNTPEDVKKYLSSLADSDPPPSGSR